MEQNTSAAGPAANHSSVWMDRRTDRPTGRPTDRSMDGWADIRIHALIYLPLCDLRVKQRHGIEYFCRCFSTGSTSQSECSDFGYGPITAEISLATSGEIENLPLKVTNRDLLKIEGNTRCGDLSANMNGVLLV